LTANTAEIMMKAERKRDGAKERLLDHPRPSLIARLGIKCLP
jgi:hypothetical protein